MRLEEMRAEIKQIRETMEIVKTTSPKNPKEAKAVKEHQDYLKRRLNFFQKRLQKGEEIIRKLNRKRKEKKKERQEKEKDGRIDNNCYGKQKSRLEILDERIEKLQKKILDNPDEEKLKIRLQKLQEIQLSVLQQQVRIYGEFMKSEQENHYQGKESEQ